MTGADGSVAGGPGLLLVLSEPRPGDLAEFNDWYDTEHGPVRAARPGWLTARRYVSDSDGTTFLAGYDLAEIGVLEDPSYRALRENRSERERRVMGRLRRIDRRVYRALGDDGDSTAVAADIASGGRYLLCVWWRPPVDERPFHRWYEEEHIPMLTGIPGWLRCRRFTLAEGAGLPFLAVHDLATTDVFDHPDYRAAVSTPMRNRVVADCRGHERILFRLLRDFKETGDAASRRPAGGAPEV